MPKIISLDIETLGTGKNAVIASIAACVVTEHGVDLEAPAFYVHLDMKEQIDKGRTVTADTIKFWMRQADEARASTFPDEVGISTTRLQDLFGGWYQAHGCQMVYVKGSNFDAAIVESLFDDFGFDCPVPFRNWKCMRSLDDVIEWSNNADLAAAWLDVKKSAVNTNKHDALSDAVSQGVVLSWFMRECAQ